jgi:type IV pilus assembly protein PilE
MTYRKGFTIIEILIVIITMTILAGVAVPAYQGAVEKSRKAEAFRTLAAIRDSEIRYQAMNGTFAGSLSSLDFDPNATQGGQNRFFTYSVTSANNSGFVASAQRVGGASYVVQINQNGVIGETSMRTQRPFDDPITPIQPPSTNPTLPSFIKSIQPPGTQLTPLANTLVDTYLTSMDKAYTNTVQAVPQGFDPNTALQPTSWRLVSASTLTNTKTFSSYPDPNNQNIVVYWKQYNNFLKPGVNTLSVSDFEIWNKTTNEHWYYIGAVGRLRKA